MSTPSSAACPACHAPLSEGAKFCHRCGRAISGSGASHTPWIVAWTMVLVSVGAIFFFVLRASRPEPAPPDMANAAPFAGGGGGGGGGAGTPPDISQMTPEERFIRLHDRVMTADEQGDTATVQRFAPMAVQAYQMLPSVDNDLRYHAGSLDIRIGDFTGALALADTIAQGAPKHLFASLLRADVAQARQDRPGFDKARKAFLDAYDAEILMKRPEYDKHPEMLAELKKQFAQQ